MTEKNAEKTISYKTAKGKTISLSPQEYEKIKDHIEMPGERLVFRHSGGKSFGGHSLSAKEYPPDPLKKALGERFDSLPQTPSQRPKRGHCDGPSLETPHSCSLLESKRRWLTS